MSDDLLALESDPTLPESTGWRPRDLRDCDWALSRIAELERLRGENLELEQAAIQRITDRTAAMNERLDKGLRYFRSCVEAFARENRAGLLVGKKKTRDLPNGSIAFRRKGGGLKVVDAQALGEWALGQEFEHAVKLTRTTVSVEPDVKAIKAFCAREDAPCVVPPGMEWVPEDEAVVVTATGSELIEGGE